MPLSALQLATLAAAPPLPAAAIPHLAKSAHPLVRRMVARRDDVPGEVRLALLRDSDAQVRRYTTSTISEPDVLADLARDTTAAVRSGLAANPHTPTSVLDEIATTGKLDVPNAPARLALANPSTSTAAVLHRVRTAAVGSIVGNEAEAGRALAAARILRAHPQVGQVWADTHDGAVVRAVARRPDLDPDVAARIAVRPTQKGMRALATNPYVDASILAGQHSVARARLQRALGDRDPRTACADHALQAQLAELGSATLDLLLVERAAQLGHPAQVALIERARPQLEPDTLALLVNGAGLEAVRAAAQRFGITRLRAAAADSPLLSLACVAKDSGQDLPSSTAIAAVFNTLGEDGDHWHTFLRLSDDTGHVPLDDLAHVAVGVAA